MLAETTLPFTEPLTNKLFDTVVNPDELTWNDVLLTEVEVPVPTANTVLANIAVES